MRGGGSVSRGGQGELDSASVLFGEKSMSADACFLIWTSVDRRSVGPKSGAFDLPKGRRDDVMLSLFPSLTAISSSFSSATQARARMRLMQQAHDTKPNPASTPMETKADILKLLPSTVPAASALVLQAASSVHSELTSEQRTTFSSLELTHGTQHVTDESYLVHVQRSAALGVKHVVCGT